MTEFSHSMVLFSGDDGLPLKFNIQNTIKKEALKCMIEYGGGLCTLSEDAIYLVCPGTTVVKANPNTKLISSKYIYDCVRQNYLLDTDEYRFQINELETSDLSDNSLNLIENVPNQDNRKLSGDVVDTHKTPSPILLNCPNSNHDFDFEDSENRNICIGAEKEAEPQCSHPSIPPQSLVVKEKDSDSCVNAVPDSLDNFDEGINRGKICISDELHNIDANDKNKGTINSLRNSPVNAVIVSSSQPNVDTLDKFDNMILNKLQEKPVEQEDECLSQSYTVSSSADAQVSSPKAPHNTSAEIFEGSSSAPDSASLTSERQQYINNLEKEVEWILQKPSPKSIQDKIVLVKYISCVKKLAPAIVLQTLQNFKPT